MHEPKLIKEYGSLLHITAEKLTGLPGTQYIVWDSQSFDMLECCTNIKAAKKFCKKWLTENTTIKDF